MFPLDCKIMIVDDSSFARTMLKNNLKELKYSKVLEADNVKSAQELLLAENQKKDPVYLLISDIHMPDATGIGLLRWVRTHERYKSLPVIMLTSSQEKNEILEVGKLGVSHYMIKPFESSVLKEKLANTWQRHGEAYYAKVRGEG